MYLLDRDDHGQLRLTEFDQDGIPPYAILSHTWLQEEVTFDDIQRKGNVKHEASHRKIDFCVSQAQADGLQYCWVDTCCINKANFTELSEAINSMFRWYQSAEKCYVYLSDVPEQTFRSSRWFTRGWTLQELLAPRIVEFFGSDGVLIGDKVSLIQDIHERTQIPIAALQGAPLVQFTVDERMSWIARRQTRREEDMAYSLLGIFDVSMPLIYGEGRKKADLRLRKHVEESPIPSGQGLPGQAANQEQFSLPFGLSGAPLIDSFTGRYDELTEIEQALPFDGTRHTAVLQGLGGMGKTQLSIEYAKKHRLDYTAVFWLNGKNETTLQQSFARAARRLSQTYPSLAALKHATESKNFVDAIDAVRNWLDRQGNSRWLLILDNVDNPRIPGVADGLYDLGEHLPTTLHGHVLITTRLSELRVGKQVRVRKLRAERECIEILQTNSQRPGIQDEPRILDLLSRLDGLPLALSTAGAYLSQVSVSVAEYLEQYELSWQELQQSSPSLPEYEGSTLQTTWELSRQQVERRSPNSCLLLELWGHFANQDIWYELLKAGRSEAPEWFLSVTESKMSFDQHMRVLCQHGLAEAQQERVGYGMHTCVHDWVREALQKDEEGKQAVLALRCISSLVPNNDTPEYWVTQKRILGHADEFRKRFQAWEQVEGQVQCLFSLGRLYHDQTKFAEAEAMYSRALAGAEKTLGEEHSLTLDTVNNLGLIFRHQGRLAEAKAMYMRALAGKEKRHGQEHPLTLHTVSNLGILYQDQGKLAEAEAMYARALAGQEEALGAEHPSTLHAIGNLGALYRVQGKPVEAQAMFMRVLEAFERMHGREHPLTLRTLENLGHVYQDQGKLAEAKAIFVRAQDGFEKMLGPDHQLTLNAVNNLGQLHYKEGMLVDAEAQFTRALAGFEKLHGRQHSLTLLLVNNLGYTYAEQGKFVEAESTLQRALEGFARMPAPRNHQLYNVMDSLGELYAKQRKFAAAETMLLRALAGFESTLGEHHVQLLETTDKIAALYIDTDRPMDAEQSLLRVQEGYEELLGPNHPKTIDTVQRLQDVRDRQGRELGDVD